MTRSRQELFEAIDRAEPIDLLSELIRIPSHRGLERQEEGVALAIGAYLESHGLEVSLEEVVKGRPNLICTLEGEGRGRHLLLCGHTDTVPLNEGDEGVGFSGLVRDGWVEGRGSVDMKGALASMAATMVALHRTGQLQKGRVTLAAIIDEEMESLGAEHLVASGFQADGAIVGEPTENRLSLGHKGLEWLEFRFQGKAAHGGTPQAGINAIDAAARFIELARTELLPSVRGPCGPAAGATDPELRNDPGWGPTLDRGGLLRTDRRSPFSTWRELRVDDERASGSARSGRIGNARTEN